MKKAKVIKFQEEMLDMNKEKKAELTALLKKEVCTIFDREPSPSFNPNLDKLVDKIINIF